MSKTKRRKVSKHQLKGPLFDSFKNAAPRTGMMRVWRPGLQSTRQQLRNLRNKAAPLLDSKDPAVMEIGRRITTAILYEPDPEYSALHLICAAMDVSDQCGESWLVCMDYILKNYEEVQRAQEEGQPRKEPDAETVKSIQGHSRLRRLLRAIVPRTFRSGNESRPEEDEHQYPGHVDGERSAGQGSHPEG